MNNLDNNKPNNSVKSIMELVVTNTEGLSLSLIINTATTLDDTVVDADTTAPTWSTIDGTDRFTGVTKLSF